MTRGSFVGRSETVELWPLSQGEIGQVHDGFVDAVFDADPGSVPDRIRTGVDPEPERSFAQRMLRGGFPEAVVRMT